MHRNALALLTLLLAGLFPASSQGADPSAAPVRYSLQTDQAWQLELPDFEPFGASGLLILPNGELLVVNDRGPEIFRVNLLGTGVASLTMRVDLFTERQLAHLTPGRKHRYDIEGIARDSHGRIYLCDEAERWILRCQPGADQAERLALDWTGVKSFFSKTDRNASFEGIAIGDNRLYVANERNRAVILVVDLETLEVVNHYAPRPAHLRFWEPHYSDLSWHDGVLYVLVRESRVILAVDPNTGAVLAEYDYRSVELDPDVRYQLVVPFAGIMEGLAVDEHSFWLVTDNNHRPRLRYPGDRRPTLFRCLRPDR
jgi:hypothetical protein